MNWLIVTSRFPWPIVHGQWLRVYHLSRTLVAQGDRVTVLSLDPDADGRNAYEEVGVQLANGISGEEFNKGQSRTAFALYPFDRRFATSIAGNASAYDAVLLSHSRLLQYSPEASRAPLVVADIGDDPVLEYTRRKQRPRDLKQWVRSFIAPSARVRYERSFLNDVTLATFVSTQDEQSFACRHPACKTDCIPNGVDIDYFQACDSSISDDNPTVVFTGHMSNPNNANAAKFLVCEVAPHLWQLDSNIRIQIVGADPSDDVLSLARDRVDVTGGVPDIRPYLWSATVAALPMQSGTGIKNKLLEAWAAGTPVVATPLACQGVSAIDNVNVLVGDSAANIAKNIIRLVQDKDCRQRIAEAGRLTVQREHTWESVASRLRAALQSAGEPSERGTS